jgi:hypothetical protein|tara:strand:- start:1073 stop:1246 length:174 start_codon:yes stop_codon:yes gene_type:complete
MLIITGSNQKNMLKGIYKKSALPGSLAKPQRGREFLSSVSRESFKQILEDLDIYYAG